MDVVRAVALARERGLQLAVRSGGHSIPGHSVSEGGIVIDLADMRALEIDVEARTAWAQTGLTALGFTTAAAEHGLGVGFGDTGSVGIGGITLGGGVGYLVRKYGLTIDDLLAADLVTVGDIRRVDASTADSSGDASREGTHRLTFRVPPARDRTVVGGLLLPANVGSIAGFMAEARRARGTSSIANIMKARRCRSS
jgi:FAD/FMN-containing dehydrogenase